MTVSYEPLRQAGEHTVEGVWLLPFRLYHVSTEEDFLGSSKASMGSPDGRHATTMTAKHGYKRKTRSLTSSTWRRKASISFQRARMRSSSWGKFMSTVLSCASDGVAGLCFSRAG